MSDDATDGATDGGASTAGPALEVRDLSAGYGDATVLDSIDASVERGELVGLVGANGAGKTTLLHAISGALAPEAGTVRVDGDDVGALSSAAASRAVAVVPQDTALSFSFPVQRLVAMGRHPHRSRFERATPRDRAHVERAMERTRTAQFADRPVDAISGGERQRVLLARALAQDAPLLLLDEPTASLDLHHAVETMALVRDLVDDGRAAVAAIHDLELAARFCDRLLLLADGEIVARGPPAAVLAREQLQRAFGAETAVEPEPIGGGVAVQTLVDGDVPARHVHVVGTGQPAAAALGALTGHATTGGAGEGDVDGPTDAIASSPGLSLGPVPTGDRAAATARALDAAVIEAPPFQAVDADAREHAESFAREADVVVLAVDADRAADDGSGADRAAEDGSGADRAADAHPAADRAFLPDAWIDVCDAADGVVLFQPEASGTDGSSPVLPAPLERVDPVVCTSREALCAVLEDAATESTAHGDGAERFTDGDHASDDEADDRSSTTLERLADGGEHDDSPTTTDR